MGQAQGRQLTIHGRGSDLLPPFLDILLNRGLILIYPVCRGCFRLIFSDSASPIADSMFDGRKAPTSKDAVLLAVRAFR
jgi:hypothetical protein